jgi:hypothetical protein
MKVTIDRFVTYKFPMPVDPMMTGQAVGGMSYKTHLVMTDGQHLMISDAQHGSGWAAIDETLVFMCDESGDIKDWIEVAGGRMTRTDQVICELNQFGYRAPSHSNGYVFNE